MLGDDVGVAQRKTPIQRLAGGKQGRGAPTMSPDRGTRPHGRRRAENLGSLKPTIADGYHVR